MDWFSFGMGVLAGLALAWLSREVRDWLFAYGVARMPEDAVEIDDEGEWVNHA